MVFEKIELVEGDKTFTQVPKNAEILITFFSNPVKDLKILHFEEVNPITEEISHLILKTIFKHITHKYPSIIAIYPVTNG